MRRTESKRFPLGISQLSRCLRFAWHQQVSFTVEGFFRPLFRCPLNRLAKRHSFDSLASPYIDLTVNLILTSKLLTKGDKGDKECGPPLFKGDFFGSFHDQDPIFRITEKTLLK